MTIKPRYAESLPDPSGAPMLAVFYHLTGAHAMLCIAEAAADTAIIIERVSWAGILSEKLACRRGRLRTRSLRAGRCWRPTFSNASCRRLGPNTDAQPSAMLLSDGPVEENVVHDVCDGSSPATKATSEIIEI